eukprot:CAMPEP_0176190302 /NCGR_PEP_ID=MMETSP0121_2-20121125/3869_1 /TAXON_ID=160619 /ORGANISM="Kryptoperidinium foliaceum, Strain CCMP 1326" /LENGTH=48 /DNA_ID= /DNA_START= /DNA_END= /DNA_ORIENTATION=
MRPASTTPRPDPTRLPPKRGHNALRVAGTALMCAAMSWLNREQSRVKK